jgi:hypothetical protein
MGIVGLGWIGLDWVGLDWIGLDWIGVLTVLWSCWRGDEGGFHLMSRKGGMERKGKERKRSKLMGVDGWIVTSSWANGEDSTRVVQHR